MAVRYRASHVTRYRYDARVSQCQTVVRLAPRPLPWQHVVDRRIPTTPAAASVDEWRDYFGNTVGLISILENHDQFTIEASSVVIVEERPMGTPSVTGWDEVRDTIAGYRTLDARSEEHTSELQSH